MVNASKSIVAILLSFQHAHLIKTHHAFFDLVWLIYKSSCRLRLVVFAMLWFELFVLRHWVIVTIPNDIAIMSLVSVSIFNRGSLAFLSCHVLKNGAKGLRLSTLDVHRPILHAVLSLVLVAVTRLLPIYWPDLTLPVRDHVRQLVCWIQRVNRALVEELLLVIHAIYVFDVHA